MAVFASPVDTATHGEYAIASSALDRPLYRFGQRIGAAAALPAEAGRYHLYAGWFCPWAQRATLVIDLAGLTDLVTVSYVDNARDGRGWAFRQATGPDPVNGFALLREAYERSEPGYDGHVSVPVLWDRRQEQIASNVAWQIDIDLASAFAEIAGEAALDLYPEALRPQIDELEEWLRPTVNQGAGRAVGAGADETAARELGEAFAELDRRLTDSRYLLGDALTLADVRLWVTLVRYDAAAARHGALRLSTYPQLWRYARDLLTLPAFDRTTDFDAIGGTEIADQWRAPAGVPSAATSDSEENRA